MAKVLVVDDEPSIRRTLKEILSFEKYTVVEATDGMDGLVKLKSENIEVVLLDIKMPNMDGMEALERMRQIKPDVPVIMLSGHGNIDTAVEAVKKGAYDYLSKPPDLNRLLVTVRNALDKSLLTTETKILKKKVEQTTKRSQIIGSSPAIVKVLSTIEKVAPTEARVLITGPNGSGKELVAQWLHEKSARKEQPFVEVNCAAIPGELIESELFGHEKGSFTSAIKQRIGKFEQAHEGTLFLDEIGDMGHSAQAKVLRALQESRITRVGGEKDILVNVRVIAATNKNLMDEIARGKFREDLYHRLAVIIIDVPPLNQRKEDIPALTNHFIEMICSEYGTAAKKIEPEALEALKNHPFTGNIRELRNIVERLIILSGATITREDVLDYVHSGGNTNRTLYSIFNRFGNETEIVDFVKQEFVKYKQA